MVGGSRECSGIACAKNGIVDLCDFVARLEIAATYDRVNAARTPLLPR